MTALKVLEHIGQLPGGGVRIERQDSVDDMIGPCFIGGVEVSRFSRRLERADDHSCRIRAQIQTLPVENLDTNEKSFE